MLSSSKISLSLGGPFLRGRGPLPPRTPNLAQTILSQTISYIMSFYFLRWAVQKFQFKGHLLGERGLLLLPRTQNLVQTVVSQISSYIMSFNFLYYWAVQKFPYGGASFFFGGGGGRPPNLVQIIVSKATSQIMSFNFLCWAVQKFHFGRAIFWGVGDVPPPPRTPKFGPNSCLTNNFLHYEFQLSIRDGRSLLFLTLTSLLLWQIQLWF